MIETPTPEATAERLVAALRIANRQPRNRDRISSIPDGVANNSELFISAARRRDVSEKQIQELLQSIALIINADESYMRFDDRVVLACQILVHATKPETISARCFNTSAAGTIEFLLYRDRPQVVAAMLANVVLVGTCCSPTGRVIELSDQNRKPLYDADMSLNPKGPGRSYASQLMQTLLMNDMVRNEVRSASYALLKEQGEVIEVLLSGKGIQVNSLEGITPASAARVANAFFGCDVVFATQSANVLNKIRDEQGAIIVTSKVGEDIRYLVVKRIETGTGKVTVWSPVWGEYRTDFAT